MAEVNLTGLRNRPAILDERGELVALPIILLILFFQRREWKKRREAADRA